MFPTGKSLNATTIKDIFLWRAVYPKSRGSFRLA